MIERRAPVFERLAALALPRGERDEILADLREESLLSDEGGSRGWVAHQMLRIGARYHLECYRDPHDQVRIMAVLLLAVALLWVVPVATAQLFPGVVDIFTNPVMLAIVNLWRASHLSSAVAAGLLVGRIAALPDHAAAARWHIVTILAAWCVAAHGLAVDSVAALALVGAAWIGDRSRCALLSDETRALS